MTDLEEASTIIDALASQVSCMATMAAKKPLDEATRKSAQELAASAVTWRREVTKTAEKRASEAAVLADDRKAVVGELVARLNALLKNKRTAKQVRETLTFVREYLTAELF